MLAIVVNLPAGQSLSRRVAPAASDAEALADMGLPGPQNPVSMGVAFLGALSGPRGPDLDHLRVIVTPESWPSWGDFRDVADALVGCGWMSRAEPSVGDPQVVYLKYVTDHDRIAYLPEPNMQLRVRAIGTMVYRPSLGGWRLHALGEYVPPGQVPHDR